MHLYRNQYNILWKVNNKDLIDISNGPGRIKGTHTLVNIMSLHLNLDVHRFQSTARFLRLDYTVQTHVLFL